MDWRELLNPTIPRIIITVLLLSYCVFTLPVITVHSTYCDETRVNCTTIDYGVSLYYCLTIDFHEEHSQDWLIKSLSYFIDDCNKLDVLWFLVIAPFIYCISFFIHKKLRKSIDLWRYGSKDGLLAFILFTITLFPGLGYSIVDAGMRDIFVEPYVLNPFAFFYVCALLLQSGRIFTLIITGVGLAVSTYGLRKLFTKWGTLHGRAYTVWVLYLILILLGHVFIFMW